MNPIWTALLKGRTTDRSPDAPSLGRLLLGELRWAVRQAVHPVKMAAAVIVVLGVGAVLGPTTPGPVLGAGWRLGVAVVLGFVALAIAHALLQHPAEEGDDDELLRALRAIVASVAVLVAGVFVVGELLAVVTGATPSTAPIPLDASLAVDGPLLAIAALLAVGVVAAGLGHRFTIPGALLFLGIGMVIGSDGLGWVAVQDPEVVQSLGVAALVVVLFDGGLSTDRTRLRLGVGPGLALATVGVAVTAGVTAVGTMALFDVSARVAWLIGAIVASTDATAVFSLLRRAPLPDRLASILQLESGANDPVAVLLTVGLLASWNAPPTAGEWVVFGAQQLLGGLAVGATIGWIGARVLRRLDLGTGGLYPILALAVGGVAYGTGASIGASGFLATYLAGIIVASEAPRRRSGIRSVLGALANGVEVGLFLLLGLLVDPAGLDEVAWTALGVTAVLLFVARPLATALCLPWFDLRPREILVVSWLGLRGAVPIVLATLAFSAGIDEAGLVFDVVFFVVLSSALVQGTTAIPLVRRVGLAVPLSPGRIMAEAVPLEDVPVDVVEVVVPAGSPLVGRRVADVSPPKDVVLSALVRGEAVVLPRGGTVLRAGDLVVAVTTDRRTGIARAEAWARGESVVG